ncbi:VOC family protein [Vibrio sp. SCSIO 43137]|uniref:VOC family protein n=1 Tax=Vibrio sp. SCSIO 43137 TaxID=3021011 RepID=UPI002307FA6B|nr:VOC family protein [Vibrio sp. SCSIO 43137]WCE31444.1 VOC family protein [Vibrio sp. SCSIO 43137]
MDFENKSINYIEFPAVDFDSTKAFFTQIFGWMFEDYGEEYMAFTGKGLMGGFFKAELNSKQEKGGALLVFYSSDLEQTLQEVTDAGAEISREIFSFPGGRRFHFLEPSGNEMAVWSDK